MNSIQLYLGNCLKILKTLAANSVDSIVCDPPYELGFMGADWDKSGIAYCVEVWQECLRVLKPGGYLLAFGGSRTYHRLACAIEDGGFEIKDQIMWIYAQGFPKSKNLKGEHEGRGTGLKPAHEPIVVARKAIEKSILHNVTKYGTGAFNIDSCRIEFVNDEDLNAATWGRGTDIIGGNYVGATHSTGQTNIEANPAGRWPANVIHDGSEEVLDAFAEFGEKKSGKPSGIKTARKGSVYGSWKSGMPVVGYNDSGTAARFFYCAKADRDDRDEGCMFLPDQEAGMKSNTSDQHITRRDEGYKPKPAKNNHPTVKPTDLMRYLCRLVTPSGGIVCDPFMGSGTTGRAAIMEGYSFVGIELVESHFSIAEARIKYAASKYRFQLSVF